MNCYNGERYLKDAITSVLNQTYPHWELIFWDNQSTDRSAGILKDYRDQRIKYFYAEKHTNLGTARRLAMNHATGQWVGFLDVDDIWLPNKLEKQIDIINRNHNGKIGLVYGRALALEKGRTREISLRFYKKQLPEGFMIKKLLFEGNFIPFLTALIPLEVYRELGGFPENFKYGPDFYLFALINNKYEIKAVQDYIAIYRKHGDSLTDKMKDLIIDEECKILSLFIDDYPNLKKRIRWIKFGYPLKFYLDANVFTHQLLFFVQNLYYFTRRQKDKFFKNY